jgi:hypothetical protein
MDALMENKYYRWISTKEELPESQDIGNSSNKYLLLKTNKYGEMLGFYSNGKWYIDYSSIIIDPVEFWLKEFDLNKSDGWKDCLKNAKEAVVEAIKKSFHEDPNKAASLHNSIVHAIEDLEEIIEIIEENER